VNSGRLLLLCTTALSEVDRRRTGVESEHSSAAGAGGTGIAIEPSDWRRDAGAPGTSGSSRESRSRASASLLALLPLPLPAMEFNESTEDSPQKVDIVLAFLQSAKPGVAPAQRLKAASVGTRDTFLHRAKPGVAPAYKAQPL
jgi:hypothetical protein